MRLLIAAVLAFAAAGSALAQSGGDMKSMPDMGNMQGMDHASVTMADGEGTVTAVSAKAGTVTIHHAPIDALKWPAMTMEFKADPPSLLQGVKVGQTVTFKLVQMGGATTLTSIQPK